MTITMYDSVGCHYPEDTVQAAAYVDGAPKNINETRTLLPHARILTITVTGDTADADICDRETGDLSPEEAARWACRHPKGYATIYTNESSWQEVKDAVAAERKRTGSKVVINYWIAEWTGQPHIPRGAVACQYLNDGNTYDKSVCSEYWPGLYNEKMSPLARYRRRQIRKTIHAFQWRVDHMVRVKGTDRDLVRELAFVSEQVFNLTGESSGH